MKLNYRDKIIAAFLIAIAIVLIGVFALIKPKAQTIKTNNEILAAKEVEKQQIEDKIAQIEPLKTQILTTYEDTNKIAEIFVPVKDVNDTRFLDEYMQKFADENEVTLLSVELGDSTVAPIAYYFKEARDDFQEVRQAADIDGSLQQAYDSSVAESSALTQRARESVIQTQYGVKINGTKENVWKYLEALKNFDKAANVNSVNIADYSFGKDAAEQANVQLPESEGGEGAEVQTSEGVVITDKSDVQLVITLYSVVDMPKPDVETVPSVAG